MRPYEAAFFLLMDTDNESQLSSATEKLESIQALEGITNSFIVTIRSVPTSINGEAEWRGSVEHVQSRERIYFIEFSNLNRFIVERCEMTVPPSLRGGLWQRFRKDGLNGFLRRVRNFIEKRYPKKPPRLPM